MPPTIREKNVARTKSSIMKSAQYLFATRGYAEAGVRDIAARARVNPALITRYFGSKLALYETALDLSLDVSVFTTADRETFGEVIATAFCTTKANAALTVPMLVFAAGDTEARNSALKIFKRKVFEPLVEWFGGAEAEDKATQVIAVVTGFYTYRLMLPLPPLQEQPSDSMHRWLARSLQEIVDR